jgi:hypothetical protein
MSDNICFYMGKPLTEFSKEELIDIIKTLGNHLNDERSRHGKTLNLLELSNKRGGYAQYHPRQS